MNNKNIILFGSSGMLGDYVRSYLKKQGLNVICIDRKDYDASLNSFDDLRNIIKKYHYGNTVIINCIGIIPQTDNRNDFDYIKVNSIFPQYLSIISKSLSINFIHITTDCVFNGFDNIPAGKFPGYDEKSIKNEIGIYGLSKNFGENILATIIRTSIIGEQKNKSYLSLLEWARSNENSTINGYINHYWNGVTCLQLSKIIYKIIFTNSYWAGIKHIHTPGYVSKYDLLQKINKIYDLNIKIAPVKTQIINKTLSSIYPLQFNIPDFDTQLLELKNFVS
jgi:dTDP-4-dehydrorhamnose reductase